MRKLGSAELYNILKTLNTSIPFTQRKLSYVPSFRAGNRLVNGTPVTGQFNNMQELYDRVFNDPTYVKGSDTIWETIMDILRQNPENMHNFVGINI